MSFFGFIMEAVQLIKFTAQNNQSGVVKLYFLKYFPFISVSNQQIQKT